MGAKFNLDAKRVYSKEFHVDFKGYSIEEVDAFLDLIIKDYQEYDSMIEQLGINMQSYEAENNRLKNEINALKKQNKVEQINTDDTYDNIDLIKRISNLEKQVFKK